MKRFAVPSRLAALAALAALLTSNVLLANSLVEGATGSPLNPMANSKTAQCFFIQLLRACPPLP